MTGMFSVDAEGLRALQKGKSKTFIINELVQNAWDEETKNCELTISYEKGDIIITVTDDSPEGFKDIRHAYTLFADTYKRRDPTKRGRFNLGEKQVVVCSRRTRIVTTKGTVVFDVKLNTRKDLPEKTESGSRVDVVVEGTEKEYKEILSHAQKLIVPKEIVYTVNGTRIAPRKIIRSFRAYLDTDVLENGVMRTLIRKATVNVLDAEGESWIYEMGIPIKKTDCLWSIDVQQKIPLAIDRETIRGPYLQDIYSEVLNFTYDILPDDEASAVWVRKGMRDKRVNKEAVTEVIKKRFGDKVLIRNPFDSNANEEAIIRGYTLIGGNQFSKQEWDRLREFDTVNSTTDVFGTKGLTTAEVIEPSAKQLAFAEFANEVANEFLGHPIRVKFVKANGSNTNADYGNATLRFNITKLGADFFDKLTWENLRLLMHELGHDGGGHIEHEYHYLLTKLGAQLILKALSKPSFFEVYS